MPLRSERDPVVDIIKGVACLLMVAAHVRFEHAPWLQSATMATVLFFSSTGMNLATIIERRPDRERRLALNALFLIFAGFADNYVQGTMRTCDVFQSAGMAMLAMLFLRRLCPRYWTALFPIPFLLHVANQQFQWKVSDGGVSSFFITPGLFPLLPWLSFYLLGAHLKLHQKQGLGWLLAAVASVVMAIQHFFVPFHFDKLWMSPDYFLIGCFVASVWFAALRRWLTAKGAERCAEIRKWGANSLVYYILNNFVLRVLELFVPEGSTLFVLSVVITAILLRPALGLQLWTSRQQPWPVLLAGLLATTAVLGANCFVWSQSYYLHTFSGFALTVSFFSCYPAWKNFCRNREAKLLVPVSEAQAVRL